MASVTLFTSPPGTRPPRTPVRDWERCINCKVQASGGEIKHGRTCPDYVRSRPHRLRVEERK